MSGTDQVRRLMADLSRREAWPGADSAPRLLQTHISLLYFVGERVYTLKKEVDFGFLDYSTLARRRHFCEEEVRLNRRLAGDTYLGVAPVTRTRSGGLRVGEPGEEPPDACEWAVVMRRLRPPPR